MKYLVWCLLAVLPRVQRGSSGVVGGLVDLLHRPDTSTDHQPLVFPEEEESVRKGLFGKLIPSVEKNIYSFKFAPTQKVSEETIPKEMFKDVITEISTMQQQSPSVEELQQKRTNEEVVSSTHLPIPSSSSETVTTSTTAAPRKKKVAVPVGGDDGRNIIDAPEKGCEEGSKKDASGKCRQVFRRTSEVFESVRFQTLY